VERGEVLGVVGGSGTGKTVLLNSIIGLKEPEGGTVSILGYDRATMTEARGGGCRAPHRHPVPAGGPVLGVERHRQRRLAAGRAHQPAART
jgi:ABC-type glutathione transport system ATPase component